MLTASGHPHGRPIIVHNRSTVLLRALQGILLLLLMSAVNISGFSELARNYEVCVGR